MKNQLKTKQKKETHSIAWHTQKRLEHLTKRENKLTSIVEKKKTHIAKAKTLLEKLETKLAKVKEQKAVELKELAQLAKVYQNINSETQSNLEKQIVEG